MARARGHAPQARGHHVERENVVHAAARNGGLHHMEIDENAVSRHLYTRHLPDPDLVVRTSGEMRLSNFLLWQLAYAEIYVTPTLWPEFRGVHLLEGIEEYQKRDRRYGGLNGDAAAPAAHRILKTSRS